MRTGIYGGTFNPIHLGHLIMAVESLHQLELDRVMFLPAPQPPHKQGQKILSFEARCEMVEAAIKDEPLFELSLIENERPGPHYALDTINDLHKKYPDCEFVFLLGGDSLRNLHRWYRAADFVAACNGFGVFRRPDGLVDLNEIIGELPGLTGKIEVVEGRLLDIASSDIRARIKEGQPFRYFLTEAVYEIIQKNEFYS